MLGKNLKLNTVGVFRCCPSSVAEQIRDELEYAEGTRFRCLHCGRWHRLVRGWVEPQDHIDRATVDADLADGSGDCSGDYNEQEEVDDDDSNT